MRKFSMVLLMIFMFMGVSYAEAQDDPCAQLTNQQEQSVCYNMTQGLTAYKNDFIKEHSAPTQAMPEATPSADLETPAPALKLPPPPGQVQPQEYTKHRNIFQ